MHMQNMLPIMVALSMVLLVRTASCQGALSMLADADGIVVLERMSKEVSPMDADADIGTGSGRAVVGDIEKIKKVVALLEAVGEAIVPALIETTVNSEKAAPLSSEPSTAAKPGIVPRGLHLLHSAITQQTANTNEGEPSGLKQAAEEAMKQEPKEVAREETTEQS